MKTSTRLREAADDLWDLDLPPGAKFNMQTFGQHPEGPKPQQGNLCRTTACAAGWLSLMPKWQARGFRSAWRHSVWVGKWYLTPARAESWDTMAERVFGATSEDMSNIFQSKRSPLEEVVLMFEDLAEDYEAMGE